MPGDISKARSRISQPFQLAQCRAVDQDRAHLDALANIGATSNPVHGHTVEIRQAH